MFTIPFMLCVQCHMSNITYHLSYVICQIFFFLFSNQWSYLVDGLLSMGRTASSCFILKTYLHPVFTYLGLQLFIKKQIDGNLILETLEQCHKQQISTCAEVCSLCFFGRSFLYLYLYIQYRLVAFKEQSTYTIVSHKSEV